jgi:mono/diheme cytochrome c family protein
MLPRWITFTLISLAVLSLLPLALVARARQSRSEQPRIHLVPDMDNQGKYKSQKSSPLFADGRTMRMPVPNTVAREELRADAGLFAGTEADGRFVDSFPVPVTMPLIQRGQERYNIYCFPCHGLSGYGNGPVAKRADQLAEGTWVPPSSLHDPLVRSRPLGHLFNTISNGIRNMPSYGGQIPVEDRWAIVAYVKALQKSQNPAAGMAQAGTR